MKLLRYSVLLLLATSLYASASFAASTPRDLRGTEIRQLVVKWEWARVPEASRYEVMMNGIDYGSTTDTVFFTYYMHPGDYVFKVRAVDAANDSFSEWTQPVQIRTSEVFQPGSYARSFPAGEAGQSQASDRSGGAGSSTLSGSGQVDGLRHTELPGNSVRWAWNAYPGASEYEVTVDGSVVGNTAATEWVSEGLWVGDHSLTVKARDTSGNMTQQSGTLKIWLAGDGTVVVNDPGRAATAPAAQAPSPPPQQEQAPPPQQPDAGASQVQSLIDPASYNYDEVNSKAGYELVFSDEFNGTALNPYRWHSQLRWDGEWNGERYEYRIVNGESQFYVNVLGEDEEHQREIVSLYNPFKFNGSRLAIQAARNPLKSRPKTALHGRLMDVAPQQEFLSGAISTHDKFSQKYGYFEARIKIPAHDGTFPAFWLFHQKRYWEGTQRTEIDVMENLGHAPQYIYNSFHYFTNVRPGYSGDHQFIKPKPQGQIYTGIDYSQDFHTYAVEWEPGKVTWLIDGVKTSELYNGAVDYEELYVMLNLAIGGNWVNFPTNAGGLGRSSDNRFPTSQDVEEFRNPQLEIDYVRVYKRK